MNILSLLSTIKISICLFYDRYVDTYAFVAQIKVVVVFASSTSRISAVVDTLGTIRVVISTSCVEVDMNDFYTLTGNDVEANYVL